MGFFVMCIVFAMYESKGIEYAKDLKLYGLFIVERYTGILVRFSLILWV